MGQEMCIKQLLFEDYWLNVDFLGGSIECVINEHQFYEILLFTFFTVTLLIITTEFLHVYL